MHGRKSLIWGSRQAFTRREPSMAVRPNSTLTKRWCGRVVACANSSPSGKSPPRSSSLQPHSCEVFVRKRRTCRIPNGFSRRATLRQLVKYLAAALAPTCLVAAAPIGRRRSIRRLFLQIEYHPKCRLCRRCQLFANVRLPCHRSTLRSYRHSAAACASWPEPSEGPRPPSAQYGSDAQ